MNKGGSGSGSGEQSSVIPVRSQGCSMGLQAKFHKQSGGKRENNTKKILSGSINTKTYALELLELPIHKYLFA